MFSVWLPKIDAMLTSDMLGGRTMVPMVLGNDCAVVRKACAWLGDKRVKV